jgi:hypothetical protein
MGEIYLPGQPDSIERKIHTIRAATRDVGDGTCRFIFGITEDILPQLASLQSQLTAADEKLAVAREALEFCASNDFKIEKTQSIAREALQKIGVE